MNDLIQALLDQARENINAEAAATDVINGFAARLEAAAGDPVAINAVITDMKTHAAALGAAVVANTPAASQ